MSILRVSHIQDLSGNTVFLFADGEYVYNGSFGATDFIGDGSLITNVDAITLEGQNGSYYLNYDNFTGVPTNLSQFTNDPAFISLTDLSASGDLTYDNTTGVFSVTTYKSADFDTDFSLKTTSELTEGNNLYFTTERIDNHLVAGTGVEYNAGTISIGQSVGITDNVQFNDVTISGNLTVEGSETIIESETLRIEDHNIELGNTLTPSNSTANEGGIILLGGTDGNKTLTWSSLSSSWTSSENLDLTVGKNYRINNSLVLSSTTLGSTIVNSSLTQVGALISGSIAPGFGNIDIGSNIFTGDGSGLINVNSDTLENQSGSYYLDWTNTTNKPSPTITLDGDASGSVTLSSLNGGTLTVTVADDSHNHIIDNVDGLQNALDLKANDDEVVKLSGDQTIAGVKTFSSAEAVVLPVGTTSERPANPVAGMFRFNTDLIKFEGYNGFNWVFMAESNTEGNLESQIGTEDLFIGDGSFDLNNV
jgi:hypothetical protein